MGGARAQRQGWVTQEVGGGVKEGMCVHVGMGEGTGPRGGKLKSGLYESVQIGLHCVLVSVVVSQ